MNNKEIYRKLCQSETTIPIFSKDWWLDAVAGENNWDVILVERGEEIIAALPYVKMKKLFFDYISMPQLTQTAGIWIKYPKGQKYNRKLSYEIEVFNEIIDKIPDIDYFSQNFHYSITNWLPFYWKGFNQTTKYTYVIEDVSDLENVWINVKSNVRGKIRKASKLVEVYCSDSIDDFYELNKKTFDRQGLKIPYSYEIVERIDSKLVKNNARKIFFAKDKMGNLHSALYLIWDSQSSYVHMVGEDSEFRNSGAGILLLWEAIKYTSEILKLKKFDFEGSMIESVESVRRAFGAVQKPYFNISKTNSKLLILRKAIIDMKRL